MIKVQYCEEWPQSWKYSYPYDQMELYGQFPRSGYATAFRTRKEATLNLVKKYVKPAASILDVAAAQGNFSLLLAEEGFHVTWNDLRSELEGYVQLKHEKGLIEYAPGNVFELGFSDHFDCVVITEIIEHVAHPDQFLHKILKMVKPGGVVIMSTPNGAYFVNRLPKFSECPDPSVFESSQFKPNADGHIFLLWPEEISQMVNKAGGELLQHDLFTNPLTAGHLKTSWILRFLPIGLVGVIETFTGCLPLLIRKKIMTASATVIRKPHNPF